MNSIALQASTNEIEDRVAAAVLEGLKAQPKRLPPWLFYDEAGSRLFDRITELPEYYLTRTERAIFEAHAPAMIQKAAGNDRLRIVELGAGSAEKTRILLAAALAHQGTVVYEPVDVSASALEEAQARLERELEDVTVSPRVADYTHGLKLEPAANREHRLVLYIGSSIGNFDPWEAAELLEGVCAELQPGDGFLLGVDLAKCPETLLAAYDDPAGVTAAFNRNILARLNRELGANFDLDMFAHRAVWNEAESRIEMHLESRLPQTVGMESLDLEVDFSAGERIHTENSYKYRPGQAEALLQASGFEPVESWTDELGWFAVCLGQKVSRSH